MLPDRRGARLYYVSYVMKATLLVFFFFFFFFFVVVFCIIQLMHYKIKAC